MLTQLIIYQIENYVWNIKWSESKQFHVRMDRQLAEEELDSMVGGEQHLKL